MQVIFAIFYHSSEIFFHLRISAAALRRLSGKGAKHMLRTDLACEARDIWRSTAGGDALPAGVEAETRIISGTRVERIAVKTREGAEALGKPMGEYLTLFPEALLDDPSGAFGDTARLLGRCLRSLLRLGPSDCVLVAGLGNEAVTPDALGPKTLRHIPATRHLRDAYPAEFARFRSVMTAAAGVTGNTGMESMELLRALVRELHPAAVIAVDALAARSLNRVCRTVQLSDTGIIPGSGVGNARKALNRESLGVPVIAVGVPTVVDALTLAEDLRPHASAGETDSAARRMMVTPREIDQQISTLSRLLGYGIDLSLHEGINVEDITALIG